MNKPGIAQKIYGKRLVALALLACGLSGCKTPEARLASAEGQESSPALRVASYNTYLLAGVADEGTASLGGRRDLQPKALLAENPADIYTFQEIWAKEDLEFYCSEFAAAGYKTCVYHYATGMFGLSNGLLIVSRFPEKPGSLEFAPFGAAMMGHDLAYTNKGVMSVTLTVPQLGDVLVITTHTSYLPFSEQTATGKGAAGADYDRGPDGAYQQVMNAQVRIVEEQWRNSTAPYKIIGADLNTAPRRWDPAKQAFGTEWEEAYGILLDPKMASMDAMAEGNPACQDACFSWDRQRNYFAGTWPDPSSRIDHIFASQSFQAKPGSAGLMMTQVHTVSTANGSEERPLSDHFGVTVTLQARATPPASQ